ncbi:BPTI/Kunitz domain-containing protein [Sorangium cellulosum]|uniref:BPTI/Kunitz domain-containing protein n=1 Tax=Sorangium TaxID=39643 RepID=UPI001F46DB8B|nr:BPTI/Kunitz domain-containing protein [Sorangium cellulosum]
MLTSLLLAVGCGEVENNGGPGGGGPGGGGSVTGSGGGAVTGSGGGAVTGSGGGSVASSGAGGELPARCALPQDVGPCDAAIPRYWHDPSTGVCVPFTWGGCDGNENRFESLAACQEACQGGAPDMDTCASAGDCVLASPRCCASCDPVDASAFVAIHREASADYSVATGCGDVACAPCPPATEAERTSQYFTAACESGRCVVLDVRESPLTECTQDADCALRDGVGCCEGCDGTGIVALNQSADLASIVCPEGFGACPPCAPVYPAGMTAKCSEGRCQPSMP